MGKKLFALLLLLALSLGLCMQVQAAEQPNPDRLCSITFVMDFDGMPLEGGSLTLYQVGEMNHSGNGFVPVEPLLQDISNLNNLQASGLAEELNELAITHGLSPLTAPIVAGQAVFTELKPGLYVVSQRSGEETPGYSAINLFLISLPQWQAGAYVYDLTAAPKVPVETAPTEPTEPSEPAPPTEPGDTPSLPQTGQLNWPIPLMAVLGLALFALGWGLFFDSKWRHV